MRKFSLLAFFSLILTACGSNPQSYITAKSEPIVNVEANIADQLDIKAKADRAILTNVGEVALNVAYKLFWYDKNGVTQTATMTSATDSTAWKNLYLLPKQVQVEHFEKPTNESENYRIYLRANHTR